MIQIDLITGFLGSGKTTFLRRYASYLLAQGQRIGIIENDFGAINVDMMLLQDLDSEQCEVEQIVGGNVVADWKRRFKAKLIAMAMQGFERVLVEPSGIYDVEAFFDVIYEEPVSNWYEAGNILTIVEANLEANLSKQVQSLLVSQLANTGLVILSKAQVATKSQSEHTLQYLSKLMMEFHCDRQLDGLILCKDWADFTENDYEKIMTCGWMRGDYQRLWFDQNDVFTPLFFMDIAMSETELSEKINQLFQDEKCGHIFRVKGFVPVADGQWLEVNATKSQCEIRKNGIGQAVLIIIGEQLDAERIGGYIERK